MGCGRGRERQQCGKDWVPSSTTWGEMGQVPASQSLSFPTCKWSKPSAPQGCGKVGKSQTRCCTRQELSWMWEGREGEGLGEPAGCRGRRGHPSLTCPGRWLVSQARPEQMPVMPLSQSSCPTHIRQPSQASSGE